MPKEDIKCKDCSERIKVINEKDKYICGTQLPYGVEIDLENCPRWCPKIGFKFGGR